MNGDERWTDDLLSAYLDDELTLADRAEVEQAVAGSREWQAELDDVRAAREAVRGLPSVDAPAEFWARVLADTEGSGASDGDGAPVVELAPRRASGGVSRWLVAAGGAAAAAMIAAIVLVPQPAQVQPPVAAFTQAHAVRSSLNNDAVSTLAPAAVQAGFRR